MTSAAIYCRISRDVGTRLGVQRQEADCRALCERHGWAVGEVYVDNDVSASTGRRRPAYEAMLGALKAGVVDAVVAWHPDRLHRSPTELEQFIDAIDAAGATVATCMAGELDLSTAAGRMTARVVGAVARHESEQKGERMARKHRELAEKGLPAGSGRPFGYEPDLVTVRPSEAVLIREAAQRILEGDSLRTIARDWNDRQVATVRGTRWTTMVLRRILTAPRTAGMRAHRGVVVGKATWPAILTEQEAVRLRAVLLDPRRRMNGGARRYLLTSIATCGLCGARLVARPKADKRRCYVCAAGPGFRGCGKIRVLAEPLEDHVTEWALDQLAVPALFDAIAAEPADDGLVEAIEAEEAQLALLSHDFYVERVISRPEFLAAREPLEARLATMRADLAQRETRRRRGVTVDAEATRAGWDAMTIEERRAVLAVVVTELVVGPAVRGLNRYDRDRVTLG